MNEGAAEAGVTMARAIVTHGAFVPALIALAGCGIIGPIYDPSLRNAPRFSCADVVLPPDASQCFRFERRRIGGERLAMNDGTLDAETEILAFQTGRPECATGDLTFATATGSAQDAGSLHILAFAGSGAQVGRDHRWDSPFERRTFRLRGAGGPFIAAPGIRIRSAAGGFRLDRICLHDYWRRDILPLRASTDRR